MGKNIKCECHDGMFHNDVQGCTAVTDKKERLCERCLLGH